jgi:hypothetical protein
MPAVHQSNSACDLDPVWQTRQKGSQHWIAPDTSSQATYWIAPDDFVAGDLGALARMREAVGASG